MTYNNLEDILDLRKKVFIEDAKKRVEEIHQELKNEEITIKYATGDKVKVKYFHYKGNGWSSVYEIDEEKSTSYKLKEDNMPFFKRINLFFQRNYDNVENTLQNIARNTEIENIKIKND